MWGKLDNANRALGNVLRDMVDAESESDYEKTMMAAAQLTSDEVRLQSFSLSSFPFLSPPLLTRPSCCSF